MYSYFFSLANKSLNLKYSAKNNQSLYLRSYVIKYNNEKKHLCILNTQAIHNHLEIANILKLQANNFQPNN